MKRIFALLTAIMLLLSACSNATVDGAGKEVQDTITNITDADNKYVQMVKGGYRVDAPEISYEDAFSAFFGTPRWKYFQSEDGQDVVEFTGDCTYQDVPVKARIQFIVDEENGTFEAAYLAFNEVPQDALTLAALISKAFEAAELSSRDTSTEQPTGAEEQIYICGISVQGVMNMSAEDVIAAFGEPVSQTEFSLEYGVDAWEGFTEDGWMCFYLYNTDQVDEISADPANFTLNSQNLAQNFDTLVTILGDGYEELGGTAYMWQVVWPYGDYQLRFTFPQGANTDMPYSIEILNSSTEIPTDNNTYPENDIMYSNLDSALVGRWRSYDGGTLEFSDTGIISSCDFKCWSTVGDNPDRIYWESSNGRVNCSAYFENNNTYKISELPDGSGTEYISLAGHNYTRTMGENGDGIIGKWDSVINSIWSFQFNADGTGFYNGKYPITWYTYTIDGGGDVLSYTLLDQTYFDYSVAGTTLTVFLSDSSRIYTKVGN